MSIIDSKEYALITSFYGDKKAKRSQVPLMNHINEGLTILDDIGSSNKARLAYIIHPLLQNDIDLKTNLEMVSSQVDSYVVGLALEYRNIANAYLSNRIISDINEIALSPLKEVNDMLIADKVQNYKDFLIYHSKTHPRAKELDQYFNNWLQRLGYKD